MNLKSLLNTHTKRMKQRKQRESCVINSSKTWDDAFNWWSNRLKPHKSDHHLSAKHYEELNHGEPVERNKVRVRTGALKTGQDSERTSTCGEAKFNG